MARLAIAAERLTIATCATATRSIDALFIVPAADVVAQHLAKVTSRSESVGLACRSASPCRWIHSRHRHRRGFDLCADAQARSQAQALPYLAEDLTYHKAGTPVRTSHVQPVTGNHFSRGDSASSISAATSTSC